MDSNTNLIWLDLEMSGLEPENHVILQVAIIATNPDLKILDEGFVCYLKQPENLLSNMNDWCQKHHNESGLIDKCLASDTSLAEAQKQSLTYIKQWAKAGNAPLCGNSIGQDRRFLYRYMPELCAFLHYRNLDVSSFKIMKEIYYPKVTGVNKKHTHNAFLDIQESILEFEYYKKNLFC